MCSIRLRFVRFSTYQLIKMSNKGCLLETLMWKFWSCKSGECTFSNSSFQILCPSNLAVLRQVCNLHLLLGDCLQDVSVAWAIIYLFKYILLWFCKYTKGVSHFLVWVNNNIYRLKRQRTHFMCVHAVRLDTWYLYFVGVPIEI